MKVSIKRIEDENGNTIVNCKTAIGEFKGIWIYNQEPIIGEDYHVELTIDKFENEPIVGVIQEYAVSVDMDNIVFTGLCEGRDDEVLYIRLNFDWIEMIDIIDGVRIGDDFVAFSADYRHIRIYPYTI